MQYEPFLEGRFCGLFLDPNFLLVEIFQLSALTSAYRP